VAGKILPSPVDISLNPSFPLLYIINARLTEFGTVLALVKGKQT
jgi:hypothetical protein